MLLVISVLLVNFVAGDFSDFSIANVSSVASDFSVSSDFNVAGDFSASGDFSVAGVSIHIQLMLT